VEAEILPDLALTVHRVDTVGTAVKLTESQL
jgi:hypothetical protein